MHTPPPTNPESVDVGWSLLILLLAIGVSAFFTASETAIIALNDAKVRKDADEGSPIARRFRRFIDHPGRFRATIQLGTTLTGLLASAFAAQALARPLGTRLGAMAGWPGTTGTAVATTTVAITGLLAFTILIFGDRLPRRLAIQRGEPFARAMARPLGLACAIATPFSHILGAATDRLLRLFNIDPAHIQENISEEEIRMMVDIGGETGGIEPQEKEMIENVFEFNNTTAAEIMVHRKDIVALPIDVADDECRETIRKCGFSRIPVYAGTIDNIQGLLNTRDYLINALDGEKNRITDLLRKPLFVPETIRADVLFRHMQKNKQAIAIVLDEYGGTSGIVSVEDLLEEIVGEIYDEYDINTHTPKIERLSETDFRMPGETDIDTAAESLDIEIEEGDFNTLGGFIFEKLNSMPTEGTRLALPTLGLEMTVEKMDGHRIDSVLVRRTPTEPHLFSDPEADD